MFAVIMAGGSGTRFWPASREHLPKQFLNITSQHTMFEETIQRVSRLVEDDHMYAVINRQHAELTRQLAGERAINILVEPVGRNTAACIGLAALHIRLKSPEEPMVVLPSDHFIADVESLIQLVKAASEVAGSKALVTLGIQPTHPETGYGYIEVGQQQGTRLERSFFTVQRFVEKPNLETACGYLATGRYYWNSGIFIFTANTILSQIEACLPELYAQLMELEPVIGTADYENQLNRIYPEMESISIDYGVLERTTAPVYVFPADFGWSDVGSWQALYRLRQADFDEQKNVLLGRTMVSQSQQNLVFSETDRLIALLGVKDLIVVDTPDALLIADQNHSQEVKQFPVWLKQQGKTGF